MREEYKHLWKFRIGFSDMMDALNWNGIRIHISVLYKEDTEKVESKILVPYL
jgi:hypothetical protein